MALILDGNRIRDEILEECRPRVAALNAARDLPGLAVVLVGHNPSSEIYVRNKIRCCQGLGIYSEKLTPPETATTADLLDVVEGLNQRPEIDSMLIQLPLPKQIDAQKVLLAVDPEKDADGLHPLNLGKLLTNSPGPRPCTPAGVMELLKRNHIPVAGKRAVVVGRSDIVGKPMSMLLLHQHATVTICHSRTANLAEICAEADILVAAIGRPGFIKREFIKPGATVVDVGINRLDSRDDVVRIFRGAPAKLEAFDRKGSVVVGDVDPIDVEERAGAYTPVPGGVGLLTVAMLMVNTIEAAERRLGAACSA
ncbi:MAG TPA: bifunctional methylenetetrahydrofolate dehydrogenase/methenyltetrahydrofolate cyclohydrolase FolD [Bryobacteraceae bacterium]|nr:bifunctional methylenetetrahydrofolate dehydrogenase/methenyltetrahydrofolate cyclohydrolase FolD [Bryobacteraceae bacterium]